MTIISKSGKTSMNIRSKHARHLFIPAVLASTVFCTFPQDAQAFTNINSTGQNSATLDPSTGYLFNANNLTFTILDNTGVGDTLGVSIDNGANTGNILNFEGAATLSGSVTPSNAISAINVQGVGTQLVSFNDVLNNTPINITSNGTVGVTNGSTITSAITNISGSSGLGVLKFQGSGTATGNIGTLAMSLGQIIVNDTNISNASVTLSGNIVNANSIIISDDKTGVPLTGTILKLNQANMNLIGNITAVTANQDTLSILQTAIIDGNIGTATIPLNLVSVAANTVVNGSISAKNTTFQNDSILSLTALNSVITGNVDTLVAGQGTLDFEEGGSVTGITGVTALNQVVLNGPANSNVTFFGNVNTQNGLMFDTGATPSTIASFANGITINSKIFSATAGNGKLIFTGGATVNGEIGNTNPIAEIDLEGAGSTVLFNNNITLGNPAGTGNMNFTPGANNTTTIQLADGVKVDANVNTTIGATAGTIDFVGGGTITGNIGSSFPINLIKVDSGAAGNKTVTLTGGTISANNITTADLTASDTLNFNGASTITTTQIGSSTNPFGTIKVGAGGNDTINGNIFATTTQFQADNTLTLGNNSNVTGAIDTTVASQGTLVFAGNSTVTGFIGNTNALKEIRLIGAGSTVNLNKTAAATNGMNFYPGATSSTTLKLGTSAGFNGNIDNLTTTDNIGTLVLLGTNTITGNIGATNSLHQIDLSGNNIIIQGTTVNVDSGNMNFTTAGTTTFTNDVIITGAIDNTSNTANVGTLEFQGNALVTGNIGFSNPLLLVNVNNAVGKMLTLQGDIIRAANIDSAQSGIHTLTFDKASVITADIGVNNKFLLVNVAGGGDDTIIGNVFATKVLFNADNTLTMGDGITSSTITGNVDSNAAGTGTLVFAGDGGVVGATNGLKAVQVAGAGSNVTFTGPILNNTPIQFLADATITVPDGGNLLDVDNLTGTTAGTLNFLGGGTVRSIGATSPLTLVRINTANSNKTVTLNGTAANATTFEINDDTATPTTLKLDNLAMNFNGNVTVETNNLDIFDINAAASVTGNAGTATNQFSLIKVAALGNTTLNGEFYATNTQFQAPNKITLLPNAVIHGPITTIGGGTLEYLGSSRIDDQIGALGNALDNILINGPQGTNVVLNNNIFVGNTSVNNGGKLTVTGQQTITGNLDINNGTLSISNTANPMNIIGNFNLKNGTTLDIDFGGTLQPGSVITSNIANVDAGAKLTVSHLPKSIADGTTPITIVSGNAGNINAIPVYGSSLLLGFRTEADNINHRLNLIVNAIPATTFANQSNTAGIAGALDYITNHYSFNGFSSVPGTLGEIVDQMDSFRTATELNKALAALAPTVDGAIIQESIDASLHAMDAITLHIQDIPLNKIRPLSPTRKAVGYSAGDGEEVPVLDLGRGVWVNVYGQYNDQKERNSIEGYHSTLGGAVAGVDWMWSEQLLAGAALSWGHANVHNAISDGSQTTVDQYQFTLYAQYLLPCSAFYVNGFAAVGYNDYDSFRLVKFGLLNLVPEATYDAWQYSAKAELGYVIGQSRPFYVVPSASLYYSHLDFDEYTETGMGTANQFVKTENNNTLLGTAGIRFVYSCYYADLILQPEIHAKWLYNFIDTAMETTSQFIGAGPSFITSGTHRVRDSYNIGAEVTTFESDGIVISLSYDYYFKEDYNAQTGFIRARYEW